MILLLALQFIYCKDFNEISVVRELTIGALSSKSEQYKVDSLPRFDPNFLHFCKNMQKLCKNGT